MLQISFSGTTLNELLMSTPLLPRPRRIRNPRKGLRVKAHSYEGSVPSEHCGEKSVTGYRVWVFKSNGFVSVVGGLRGPIKRTNPPSSITGALDAGPLPVPSSAVLLLPPPPPSYHTRTRRERQSELRTYSEKDDRKARKNRHPVGRFRTTLYRYR